MAYQIEYLKPAQKALAGFPKKLSERIIEAIEEMAADPDAAADVDKLKGQSKGPTIFRLRVGGFRVLFKRDDDKVVILVIDIGSRGDIYKKVK